MRYKEAEIVLEVMDVGLQISGSDCGLHAVVTAYEAMTQLALHGSTINFAHAHLQQSSHFRGKVRDLVVLLGLQFKPPFFWHLLYARRTVSEQD